MPITFLFIFITTILISLSHSSEIISIQLSYQPFLTVKNRYSLYFQNYSNPISISFSHTYNYLDYSFFPQTHKDPSEYPLPQHKSEFLSFYYLFEDNVTFLNQSSSFLFPFYSTNSSKIAMDDDFKDIITLRYSSTNYDCIRMLQKQNVIPKPQLGFFLQEKKLFLGGIPSFLKLKLITKYYSTVSSLDSRGWNFQFESIQMGEIKLDLSKGKSVAMIQLSGSSLGVPPKFFQQIEDKYFKKYYANKDCYVKQLRIWEDEVSRFDSGFRIFCLKKVITTFPEITISVNKSELTLRKNNMFNCDYNNDNDYCLFELADRMDNDAYYFGTSLLKEFLVLCNYEDSSISFYYNENRIMFGDQQKVIMIWVILIILIGIFCLIGNIKLNNKKI